MKALIILFIRSYQTIASPYMHKRCRFYPSCSYYGIQAVKEWGTLTGIYLLIKRLLKCHPFGQSGVDLVPEKIIKETLTDLSQ